MKERKMKASNQLTVHSSNLYAYVEQKYCSNKNKEKEKKEKKKERKRKKF